MAAEHLPSSILNFISEQRNQTCNLHDIIRGIGFDKKLINKELYRLKQSGAVEKLQDSPPVWKISSFRSNLSSPMRNFRGRQRVKNRVRGFGRKEPSARKRHSNCNRPDLAPKILNYLQSHSGPVRTIALAKHLGLGTSTEINPTLYALQRKKLIRQTSNQPAFWVIDPGQVSGAGNSFMEMSGAGNSFMEMSGAGNSFMKEVEGLEENWDDMQEDEVMVGEGSGQIVSHGTFAASSLPSQNFQDQFSTRGGTSEIGNKSSYTMFPEQTSQPFSPNIKEGNDSFLGPDGKTSEGRNDVEKVLHALLRSPMNTARMVLLKQKLNFPQDRFDKAVNECQKLKYAKNSDNVALTMTPAGENFMKGILNQCSTSASVSSSTFTPAPPRGMSKTFEGRPPSPRQLLKMRGENVDPTPVGCAPGSYPGRKPVSSTKSSTESSYHYTPSSSFPRSSASNTPGSVESFSPMRPEHTSSASSQSSSTSEIPSLMSIKVTPPSYFRPSQGEFSAQNSVFQSKPQDVHLISRSQQSLNNQEPSKMPSRQSVQSMSCPTFPQSSELSSEAPNVQGNTHSSSRGIDRNIGSSGPGFKPPPPPIEFVQQQLKKTEISPPSSYSSPSGFSQGMSQSSSVMGRGSSQETSAFGSGNFLTKPAFGRGSSLQTASPFSENLANAGIQRLLNASRASAHSDTSVATPVQRTVPSENLQSQSESSFNQYGPPSVQSALQRQGPTVQGQGPLSLLGQGQSRSLPDLSNPAVTGLPSGPASLGLSSESFAALSKNPVSALMEYAQSRKSVATIEVIRQSGPSHRPKFVMGAFIGDQKLSEVTCSNKKDGRKEAADKALRALIASGQYNVDTAAAKPQIPASQMTHFDKIAALTHQAFNSLSVTIAENFSGRKVIAGLVMKTSPQDPGTVISVGTGNRCITGTELSLEGNTVNDSHAEIITRRGFIRFLYKQILSYEPSKSQQMFVPSPSGKLRVRDGVTFHLYISTAPCGDGALFSSRDAAANNAPPQNVKGTEHDPIFTSDVQGLLRTKIEGGEGTIPVERDFVVQTFDGIQRGERLRTMSCTDKICRWNIVGMQGALLSHFLEPIYLDSLTLGTLYDHRHLARAVCCRVAKDGADVNSLLPSGYKLNHPWLGRVTVCEVPRETQKTKSLSLNWCYGDTKAEVTDGTKGLCYTSIEKTLFSRCSKKSLYENFKELCQKFNRQDLLAASNYKDAKMKAKEFVAAKTVLYDKMAEYKFGPWVSKPVEEEMFG